MIPVSPSHLREMARAFQGGMPHPDAAGTPDGAHVARVRDGRVEIDGATVFESPGWPLPDTVALAPEGDRAVFQVPLDARESAREPGQPTARVMQVERRRGWFGRETLDVLPAYNLPGPASALGLDPRDGRLGVAMDREILEVPWGTQDWNVRATLPEPIVDFEYLHDGSLAVCTRPEGSAPRFYVVPAAGGAPVAVRFQEFDPAGFERQQAANLPWSGLEVADLPKFRTDNPWLFEADGAVAEHGVAVSPSGRQALVMTPGEAGQARLYDAQARTFTSLGQFDARRLDDVQFLWDVDRGKAGAWVPGGQAGVLHLWDLRGGESLVVPEVSDFRYDPKQGSVRFTPPGGTAPEEHPLAEVGRVRQAPWWPEAHARHLAGLQASTLGPAAAPAGDIVQGEQTVTIGGITLGRRG